MRTITLFGAAFGLVLTACASPRCADTGTYDLSKKLLAQGTSELAKKDFSAANKTIRRGLEVLGNSYSSDDVIDDTGLKLSAADYNDANGKHEIATEMRQRMLASRLKSYAYTHHCRE